MALLLILCTPNKTDDNKLTHDVFGITLYYGDTYIKLHLTYNQKRGRKKVVNATTTSHSHAKTSTSNCTHANRNLQLDRLTGTNKNSAM